MKELLNIMQMRSFATAASRDGRTEPAHRGTIRKMAGKNGHRVESRPFKNACAGGGLQEAEDTVIMGWPKVRQY